jgi:hypothetical protein
MTFSFSKLKVRGIIFSSPFSTAVFSSGGTLFITSYDTTTITLPLRYSAQTQVEHI